MFSADRDLLILEPRLFFDVAWTAQTLVNSAAGGAINAAGDVLTLTGFDLEALGVGPGAVAIVGSTPIEVVERLSPNTIRVSLLRASRDAPVIPTAPGSNLKVFIHTFAPQIAIVHGQLMRLLGIEPGAASAPGRPAESDITNPDSLRHAESLGAMHLIMSAAAALVGHDSPLWTKATMYAQRFRAERARVVAEIDLDADGQPDTIRRPNVLQFTRA